MEFKKYQHIERYGTQETEGIDIGITYVFPKIDGTNSSVWLAGEAHIQCGSRKRTLAEESDNAGFWQFICDDGRFEELFHSHPDLRLFGEWLVPHSLKTYREDAWRKFYVFDVVRLSKEYWEIEVGMDAIKTYEYLPYEEYQPLMERYGIDYIPPIAVVENGNLDTYLGLLERNTFLIEDGKGIGEGLVIKNYDYKNKYGRQTWAKIVTSEFKEKHVKEMGAPTIKGKGLVEIEIVDQYVTQALVDKVHAKIVNETGWHSKAIPQLLGTVYHDLITEETWNFIKKHKNPRIDFKALQRLTTTKIKTLKPELF